MVSSSQFVPLRHRFHRSPRLGLTEVIDKDANFADAIYWIQNLQEAMCGPWPVVFFGGFQDSRSIHENEKSIPKASRCCGWTWLVAKTQQPGPQDPTVVTHVVLEKLTDLVWNKVRGFRAGGLRWILGILDHLTGPPHTEMNGNQFHYIPLVWYDIYIYIYIIW